MSKNIDCNHYAVVNSQDEPIKEFETLEKAVEFYKDHMEGNRVVKVSGKWCL